MRWHDPDNWPLLREALIEMGRAELIGNGPHCLVPRQQPAQLVAAKPGVGRHGQKGSVTERKGEVADARARPGDRKPEAGNARGGAGARKPGGCAKSRSRRGA